jgi:hypothetical protein
VRWNGAFTFSSIYFPLLIVQKERADATSLGEITTTNIHYEPDTTTMTSNPPRADVSPSEPRLSLFGFEDHPDFLTNG